MLCSKCIYYTQTNTYTKCMLFNTYVNIVRDYKCKGFLFTPKFSDIDKLSNVKTQLKK